MNAKTAKVSVRHVTYVTYHEVFADDNNVVMQLNKTDFLSYDVLHKDSRLDTLGHIPANFRITRNICL